MDQLVYLGAHSCLSCQAPVHWGEVGELCALADLLHPQAVETGQQGLGGWKGKRPKLKERIYTNNDKKNTYKRKEKIKRKKSKTGGKKRNKRERYLKKKTSHIGVTLNLTGK